MHRYFSSPKLPNANLSFALPSLRRSAAKESSPAEDPKLGMAGAGVCQQSLRKAIGALKDSTTVGLAKVNSGYKELDIAIVKATNHVEHLSKEKHIRTIFDAASATRPQADVTYCIQALSRRLTKTHNWAVALKTLIIIHRALREADPTFREELLSFTRIRGQMLNLSHFKDDSSPNAWDYSAWVRTYALYLEERLECFRVLNYDVETDDSKTKELNKSDMLEQFPPLQQLLFRLISCQPEGAAINNHMIQYALSMVVGESAKLYTAINDGTHNLMDKFFEMQKHEAVRALDIYRKAVQQAEKLSELFEFCMGLDHLKGKKFIKVDKPPESFISSMEEYIKEAPLAVPNLQNVGNDDKGVTPSPKVIKAIECDKSADVSEKIESMAELQETPKSEVSGAQETTLTNDVLGSNDLSQEASTSDEKNSQALATVRAEKKSLNTGNGLDSTNGATEWELALLGAPISRPSAVAESKLAGGLDKMALDSLYDNAITRTNQNGSFHMGREATNPFESDMQDPFRASNNIVPPTNVQMAVMAQQQSLMQQQQQQQQQLSGQHNPTNPFGNPYEGTDAQSHLSQNSYMGLI